MDRRSANSGTVHKSCSEPISRRNVIRLVGLGAVAAGVAMGGRYGVAAAGAQVPLSELVSSELDSVVGTVSSPTASGVLVETRTGGQILLEAASGARLYSGIYGRVPSTAAFLKGDRVVAQGTTSNGRFTAFAIGSLYRRVTATVQQVDVKRNIATCDIGRVDFSNMTLPADHQPARLSPLSLRPGDQIHGLLWTDPRDGNAYLAVAARP